ncbi:MAG: hypothetical protein NTZ78_04065 [Candidatus Aureabacteria bacterium]|nr:hypothetical protein [Candidatus Auribacterota bacterium]
MKTTREIGDDIKSLFDLCATTTAASVESGKPFFCTQPGSWGFQTGTALLAPTPTPTPTQTPTQTPTFTPTATATPWCAENGGYWSEDDLGGYGCWFLGGTYGGNCNSECGLKGLVCRQSNWNDTGCLIGTHFGMHGTCQTASETSRPGMPLDGSTEWYRISVNQDCAANIHPGSVRLCVCDQP